MRVTLSGFCARSLAFSRSTVSRDFAEVLPEQSVGAAILVAAAVTALFGFLDVVHYLR